MSYQVLARRWRPEGFDEVFGQSHVTTPLRNAIRSDRVPHAILLCGPRGVGKTTLARILARCLNCEKGPTETPCGACGACQEISEGRSTDVQEIDAASRTSVDDVRELIEAVRYAPSPGKHRIFVVDEVHMLSTAAFNALLKTLEEPPPRSLFVFCTTNPEKIPFTVVSRCQRYDLRRIKASDVVSRLTEVCKAEGVTLSDTSLQAIARESEGSLRDALTLLDQVIASGGEAIDDARVAELLDLVDRRLLLAIAEACVDGDARGALEACGRAAEAGVDAKRLGGALLQILRDLVVLRVAPDAGLVEGGDAEVAELRAIAERAEEARLRRMFRALVKEQEDLAWAPQPHAVLEMAVIRLAQMPAGDDVATLLARLDALEKQTRGGGGGSAPAGGGSGATGGGGRSAASRGPSASSEQRASARAQETEPPSPATAPEARGPASAGPAGPGAQRSQRQRQAAGEVGPKPASDSSSSEGERSHAMKSHPDPANPPSPAAQNETPPPDDAPLDVVFDQLRRFAQQRNRGLFAALEGGRLVLRGAERLRLAVSQEFAARRLRARLGDLEEVCQAFFGTRLRVEVECDAAEGDEATGPDGNSDLARRRRQEALDHPAVNATLEVLGGEIVEIRPLGGGR